VEDHHDRVEEGTHAATSEAKEGDTLKEGGEVLVPPPISIALE